MAYPLFVNLQGKRCVVVGAGKLAERRVTALHEEGAVIRIVAPQATDTLKRLAATGAVSWMRSLYYPAHLEGAFLVIAATDLHEINRVVARDANERNMLVCCVDDPTIGNYVTAATVERGEFKIALTTSGASPTLASVLRTRLEKQFGPEWSLWTALFSALRTDIQRVPDESERKAIVDDILTNALIEGYITSGLTDQAEEAAKKCILSHSV